MLVAERIDFGLNLVAHPTRLGQPLLVGARESGGIIERPVQPRRNARKDRTTFRFSFAADGDHELKNLPRLPYVERALRFVSRNIDAEFIENFDDERIDCAWLKSGALRFKELSACLVQERRGHLATGAVMNTNE